MTAWEEDHRDWVVRVTEAERPMGLSLAFLLYAEASWPGWAAVLLSMAVVLSGNYLAEWRWTRER